MTKGEFTDIHITLEKKYWDYDLLRKLEFGSSTFDRPNVAMTCNDIKRILIDCFS